MLTVDPVRPLQGTLHPGPQARSCQAPATPSLTVDPVRPLQGALHPGPQAGSCQAGAGSQPERHGPGEVGDPPAPRAAAPPAAAAAAAAAVIVRPPARPPFSLARRGTSQQTMPPCRAVERAAAARDGAYAQKEKSDKALADAERAMARELQRVAVRGIKERERVERENAKQVGGWVGGWGALGGGGVRGRGGGGGQAPDPPPSHPQPTHHHANRRPTTALARRRSARTASGGARRRWRPSATP